jgi:hypothetical protein
MKLLKTLRQAASVTFLALAFQLLSASPALAQTSAWSGVCVDTAGGNPDVATIQGLQCLLANVLAVFLTIVGIAAFLMLIVASFQILFSGGSSQTVEKAQKSVTFAVIGLIIALSAFIILNLVASFTGVNTILEFKIPSSEFQWQ